MSVFALTILGISSATPTLHRHPTAQALQYRNRLFLIDCGEGTQVQCMRFGVKFFRTERIFISHMHPDHYLGLLGVITTMNLQGRKHDLHLHAPQALQAVLDTQFEASDTHLRFKIHFHAHPHEEQVIFSDSFIEVRCIPVFHRVPCWGFFFQEKTPYRKLQKEKLESLNLPKEAYRELREGRDYVDTEGRIYPVAEYVLEPQLSSYAFITDTLFKESIAQRVEGAKVVYHEATYLHDKHAKALDTFHSTAQQAGEFAQIAGCRELIIGHFSARYDDLQPLLKESQSVFPNTVLGEEGKVYLF